MSTTDNKRTNNKLDISKQWKLCNWMTENVDKLHRKTRAEQAELATADLGFKVTGPNISSCLDATGLKVEPFREPSASNAVPVLKAAVIALYQRLGEPVPADLLNLEG